MLERKVKMIDQKTQQVIWKNRVNNAQGHAFESYIKTGCQIYSEKKRAEIDKTPEPFRVMKKYRDGTFTGRFVSLAQPDFKGTLSNGQSIVFEAKYTSTDKFRREVVTKEQADCLDRHKNLGAVAAVCAGMQDEFYFVPWDVWKNMKTHFGHNYATKENLYPYRVKFTGAVLFLDYVW